MKRRLYIRCYDHSGHDRDPRRTCRRAHRRRGGRPPHRRAQGRGADRRARTRGPVPPTSPPEPTTVADADEPARPSRPTRSWPAAGSRPVGGRDRPAAARHPHHRELPPPPRGQTRRRNRRPSRCGPSRSTPAGSSGSRSARSAAGSGSSVRPRSRPCPPTARTCCAATASVLEVSSDGELGASLDGFSILRGAPRNLDDIRALGLGKELLLKVNPNIVVDVEVTAGSLNTERVPHLGKVRVTAGGAKLLDVERDQRRADPGRSGHHQGRHHHRPQPDPGRVRLAVDHPRRRLERHDQGRRPARQGQLDRRPQRGR